MSRLIDSEIGQFRQVEDGLIKRFLFECPDCHEMLPMTEEILSGDSPVNHESKIYGATFCSFRGKKPMGRHLIAAIQANLLNGIGPCRIE